MSGRKIGLDFLTSRRFHLSNYSNISGRRKIWSQV